MVAGLAPAKSGGDENKRRQWRRRVRLLKICLTLPVERVESGAREGTTSAAAAGRGSGGDVGS